VGAIVKELYLYTVKLYFHPSQEMRHVASFRLKAKTLCLSEAKRWY